MDVNTLPQVRAGAGDRRNMDYRNGLQRLTANAVYGSGKADLHLTWRWIGSTANSAPHFAKLIGFPAPVVSVASTGSRNYFDAGLGYRLTENLSTRFNIANLLDTDPPLMADAVFANNTDERMYDIFGRSYQLSFTLRYP